MSSKGKTENIFLFVPNLIGYARIVLAIISFYYMPKNYIIGSGCYVWSAFLDALDGHAARYFNQSTKFGAILDQLTDRCGSMCLLMTLSNFYPEYTFWFQILITIDVTCHWIYIHSSILQGKTSHKFIELSENAIMRLYYSNPTVLFLICATNEVFFASLYLVYFTTGPLEIFYFLCYFTAPSMIIKTFINLVQAYVACQNIAIIDMKERAQIKKD